MSFFIQLMLLVVQYYLQGQCSYTAKGFFHNAGGTGDRRRQQYRGDSVVERGRLVSHFFHMTHNLSHHFLLSLAAHLISLLLLSIVIRRGEAYGFMDEGQGVLT